MHNSKIIFCSSYPFSQILSHILGNRGDITEIFTSPGTPHGHLWKRDKEAIYIHSFAAQRTMSGLWLAYENCRLDMDSGQAASEVRDHEDNCNGDRPQVKFSDISFYKTIGATFSQLTIKDLITAPKQLILSWRF